MTCQSHSRQNSLPASQFAFVTADPSRTARYANRGFTLIEMLVSLAITLIMMGAVVTLFGVVSESVSKSRSLIETSDRLRAAREVIQQDLQGATASLTPPLSPENDQGYFEIIEGPSSDGGLTSPFHQYNIVTTPPVPAAGLFGDCDDALMLTVRSRSGPFLGKYADTSGVTPTIIESPVAEVVYFLVQDGPIIDATTTPPMRLCTLYRRVLLVSPSLTPYNLAFADFYSLNDVSAHHVTTPTERLIPNTLGDLTKRENRFAHYGDITSANYGHFPFLVNTAMLPKIPFAVVPIAPTIPNRATYTTTAFPTNRPDAGGFLVPLAGNRLGDDVLLTNVVAFDVRVWDSAAELRENNGVITRPNDPGWGAGTNVTTGAYVDLGYDTAANGQFALPNPHQKPYNTTQYLLGTNADNRIYDTWSLSYENDGINQDGTTGAVTDGGTNGLDDNANGLIDEQDLANPPNSEWDTQPPYAIPLRGVEITLRVYEPSSQQVREVMIIQNFDPKK